MQFDLDDILLDDILFHMENQDGDFFLDTHEGMVVSADNYDNDERYISLPSWESQDGYRLMEKFTVGLKNPVVRSELSAALNRSRGVFRAFKNTLEQYPETEKLWFSFKERQMKNEVITWYNSLREEWGLQPVGSEPEDTSSLVLEDFILRPPNACDSEKAEALHKLCIDEQKDDALAIYETMNPFAFPGDICFVAENANSDFAGYICAVNETSHLHIRQLEVKPEYRGMGLGKTLLAKLLEKAKKQGLTITIDLPAGLEFFSRSLHLEEFKPCLQRYSVR